MQWMFAFSFKQAPLFLTFGAGELAKLPDAVRACDGTRALLVASPSQRAAAARAETLLEAVSIGRFDGVAPHVPGPAVEALVALARDRQADVLIALGGGVSSAADFMLDAVRGKVDELTTMVPRGTTRIVVAQLGNDAGQVGAATMAFRGGLTTLGS